ncbi:MAG: haloalkane dehalogenase [Acidobacteriota bacterium]
MARSVLRTPEERFHDLPDYPFEPHYAEVDGLRIHYVDEGPRDAAPVLMLHGEPSWSFLYRFMIPICAEHHRVIVPDLVGFGKSDKPTKVSDYSYQSHMDWMRGLVVDALDLSDITLFCQDWGSLIGLRLAAEEEARFARIVVGNGFLPTGDQPFPAAFKIWRAFARFSPVFPISKIVDTGTRRQLTADERRAYDAPFPSARHKAGARAFPALVPTSPNDPATPANRAAWEVLERWQKPFLTTFSTGDPITRGADRFLRSRIPGAEGLEHSRVRGGHFLQEDSGPELAAKINALIAAT